MSELQPTEGSSSPRAEEKEVKTGITKVDDVLLLHRLLLRQLSPQDATSSEPKDATKLIKQHQQAIHKASDAFTSCGDDAESKAKVYCDRSYAYASLSRLYRSRSASNSESNALYGLDPTHLAQLALADAAKAVELHPTCTSGYSHKGLALFLLERYMEAEAAYLSGLGVDPTSEALQEGLKLVKATLTADSGDSAPKRQRAASRNVDDFECILCMKLLFEPVTTPCGHTFCRGCFARAMDHGNKCPLCRTVLHCGQQLPMTVTLATIIQRSFPEDYDERRAEEIQEAAAAVAAAGGQREGVGADGTLSLPLFVMSTLLPGEKSALNVFEPRYRLMIRRAMEGNRRFGMAQVGPGRAVEEVLTEVEILECNPQPDGRYYIEIEGRRRLKLISTTDLDGYRLARVRPFTDDPEPEAGADDVADPQAPSLTSLAEDVLQATSRATAQMRAMAAASPRAAARVRELLTSVGQPPASGTASGNRLAEFERLSFWAANLLISASPAMDASDRMSLLCMVSTRQRLSWLKVHMDGMTPAVGTAGCSIM